MADIELVIKMPKEMWEKVKDGYIPLGISKYLKNGTLLPEGHGRLIDADKLKVTYDNKLTDVFTVFHFLDELDEAPTIIEADKESEDNE